MYTPKPSDSVSASVPDGVLFFVLWLCQAGTPCHKNRYQQYCCGQQHRNCCLKSFRINKTLKLLSVPLSAEACLKSFRINKTLKHSGEVAYLRDSLHCLLQMRYKPTKPHYYIIHLLAVQGTAWPFYSRLIASAIIYHRNLYLPFPCPETGSIS